MPKSVTNVSHGREELADTQRASFLLTVASASRRWDRGSTEIMRRPSVSALMDYIGQRIRGILSARPRATPCSECGAHDAGSAKHSLDWFVGSVGSECICGWSAGDPSRAIDGANRTRHRILRSPLDR